MVTNPHCLRSRSRSHQSRLLKSPTYVVTWPGGQLVLPCSSLFPSMRDVLKSDVLPPLHSTQVNEFGSSSQIFLLGWTVRNCHPGFLVLYPLQGYQACGSLTAPPQTASASSHLPCVQDPPQPLSRSLPVLTIYGSLLHIWPVTSVLSPYWAGIQLSRFAFVDTLQPWLVLR